MRNLLKVSVCAALAFSANNVSATESQSLEELRNTVINLLEGLVQKGVLTREQAGAMVTGAQTKAAEQARAKAAQDAAEKDAVRVTHIPEIVREQIRNEMRNEVTADVTKEVIASAKSEGWGVPGALPDWAKNVKLYGDVRARYQADWFADENLPVYLDINRINRGATLSADDAFLNTTLDRKRMVGRVRAGAVAQLGGAFSLDVRFTSGNEASPVSTNQTLGNYGGRWSLVVDKAALQWNPISSGRLHELDVKVGRFGNPFIGINELIWDNDVTFEGVAATYAVDLFGRDAKKMERGVFLTLGAFPLQEEEFFSDDKWLYGAQLGLEWGLGANARVRMTGGYFEYDNITGVRNPFPGSEVNNFTAPEFVQKGNTLYNIDFDPVARFALAGRYRLANANLWVDLDLGATHVMFGGEYVKNIGWDAQEVLARTGGVMEPGRLSTELLDERTSGYEFGVTVGHPKLERLGHWRTSLFYKYVEQDAVLDAFTDSDFHLGGTDAKGYQFVVDVGLSRNAWLRARYLSANEIHGISELGEFGKLGVDSFQLDLNGQF